MRLICEEPGGLGNPGRRGLFWGGVLSGLCAVLTACIFLFWRAVPFQVSQFDDAYMFLRYAHNFLEGHGIRWNVQDPATYGISSLLYLFQIIALLKTVPLPDPQLLVFASFFDGLAALIVITETVCRHAFSGWMRKRYLVGPLVAVPLLMAPSFRYQLFTGMDTMLSVLTNAALVWALLAVFKKPALRRALVLGIISYLSILCRPDNLVYAVLSPVLFITGLVPKDRARLLAAWGLSLGLLLSIDSVVKFAVFGYIIPLPIYTKQPNFYPNFYGLLKLNPFTLFLSYLVTILPFLIPGLLSLRRSNLGFFAVFFAPQLLTAVILCYGVQIMGMNGRFYFPGLPFAVTGSFLLLDDFLVRGTEQNIRESFKIRGLIAALILLMMPAGLRESHIRVKEFWRTYLGPRYDTNFPNYVSRNRLKRASWWELLQAVHEILKRAPAGISFAASEHGYLSSQHLGIRMIDVTGLHDAYIVRHGFSAAHILSQKPDLIWFPHSDYIDAVGQFWDIPDFWNYYEYYPLAFEFGFAIRRTGAHYAVLKESFSRVWKEFYPDIAMESQQVSDAALMKAMLKEVSSV